jgi:HAD superfamily hydrolase (TIGR01549 family)
VSIDLFDTLVYRCILEPTDVFYLQYRLAGKRLEMLSADEWFGVRRNAEADLRKASWPAEIELATVYRRIQAVLSQTEEEVSALLDAELAVEAEVIHPYVDLVDTLKVLNGGGITIVVMTDTYLPEVFIHSVLKRFLDFDYTLLCSSATGKTKRSGSAFVHLHSEFRYKRIVHFGDNHRSDVAMARGSGIAAFQTRWARQNRLASKRVARYGHALWGTRLLTPLDNVTAPVRANSELDEIACLDEIAWRWSFVLVDFLLCVRRYANRIKADEIWFLSRDCETMFKSIGDVPDIFAGVRCRYVYGSRACIGPVVAKSDPALYEEWRGRKPEHQDECDGNVALDYYNALVAPDVSRILMVDIGWKGRLQVLLDRTLPSHVEVFGYYFSLEPNAERFTKCMSETFLEWDQAVFNQALVEALSGYLEASAVGFKRMQHGIEPLFRDAAGDRSPGEYCVKLRAYISALLSGHTVRARRSWTPDIKTRKAAVRQMCLYPDLSLMKGFSRWSIATLIDGSDTNYVASGGNARAMYKILGLHASGNVWPSAAVWTLAKQKAVGRLLQHLIRIRFSVKRYLVHARNMSRRLKRIPIFGTAA